jgi:hypothetical protein
MRQATERWEETTLVSDLGMPVRSEGYWETVEGGEVVDVGSVGVLSHVSAVRS